ncbi:hypothetical protein GYMLUDRAFT_182431, partial [Collybiopsis luxurians FD-317 M1]
HKISFKIIHSTTCLLPQWQEQVAATDFMDCVLPSDVATHWNSTYNMLATFLEMKDSVSGYLDCSSNGLSEFCLSEDEWEAVQDLVTALKVRCYDFFSSNSPNVATVIPAMDAIYEAFATGIVDNQVMSDPICHALSIGKKTLNKYYSLTDNSDIY